MLWNDHPPAAVVLNGKLCHAQKAQTIDIGDFTHRQLLVRCYWQVRCKSTLPFHNAVDRLGLPYARRKFSDINSHIWAEKNPQNNELTSPSAVYCEHMGRYFGRKFLSAVPVPSYFKVYLCGVLWQTSSWILSFVSTPGLSAVSSSCTTSELHGRRFRPTETMRHCY
jgi:hypothetical protein